MRNLVTKIVTVAAAATLTMTAAQTAQATPDTGSTGYSTAYFEFTDAARNTAVFKLTNPAKIAEARELLRTGSNKHLNGVITKRRASYNPQWSYHYIPDSVEFADITAEVCDASISYVEEHLDEAGGHFLPDLRWCPWSSKLTREIKR